MIHDGPETPRRWADGVWPTPVELSDWLVVCTPAERVSVVEDLIAASQDAYRCLVRHGDVSRLGDNMGDSDTSPIT